MNTLLLATSPLVPVQIAGPLQFQNNSGGNLNFQSANGGITFVVQETVYESGVATWDLTLDSSGNIALASEPYSLAQDAATGCRTFLGECYYDTTLGVPYWQDILGKIPAYNLIRQQFIQQALLVPDVVNAQVFFSGFNNRVLTGQIQVTNTAGVLSVVSI